jgi:predicted lipoprotein with Yx(FWY)xxD motif
MGARLTQRIAPVAVLAAVCAGVALAEPWTGPPTVNVSSSALGTNILVGSKGLTLYHYVPETKGTIKCTGACTLLWPPLVVPAGVKPVAGPGLTAAKLGTIKRPDGRMQVTYNGLTLYRDYYDKPGDLNGQGQTGSWFAVTPAGQVTKARVPSTSAGSTPTTGGQAAGAGRAANAAAGQGGPEPFDCVPGASCEGG